MCMIKPGASIKKESRKNRSTKTATGKGGSGTKPDCYVTAAGDAIPTNKSEFDKNTSMMQNVDGKYVGDTSQGPVRIRIEGPHPMDDNFNGDIESDHFVNHFHIEHRKNGATGQWGKGYKNKTSLPMSWIGGED